MVERILDSFENTEVCIIFIDMINSSSFSSFVGNSEYVRWVLLFQRCFDDLAKDYFGDNAYIGTTGDEGFLFIPKPKGPFDKVRFLYKAISFVFEIKTIIKLLPFMVNNSSDSEQMPYGIRLAAGLHYGSVSYTYRPKGMGIEVGKYYGYNINFAKRIETASRGGLYSNVYVSKEIYDILKSKIPIFFHHHRTEMKGIDKYIDVYEIRSLFVKPDISMKLLLNEQWAKLVLSDMNKDPYYGPVSRHEPWFHSYLLSIIFQLNANAKGKGNEDYYSDMLSEKLFSCLEIDDPLIRFMQAIEYRDKGDLTLSVDKQKKILKDFPGFLYARIEILKTMLQIVENPDNTPHDLVYIRDSSKELLDYYGGHLTEIEKADLVDINKTVMEKIKMC